MAESVASDWIGAGEAAKMLGVCHKTVTVYQQKGIIPGVQIGRKYKFSRAAIEKLLAPAVASVDNGPLSKGND